MASTSRLAPLLRSLDAAIYYRGKATARSVKRTIGLPTFPPKRYATLYADIERMMPAHILEIGTNDGTNAVNMCRLASKGDHPVRYYGFDLFEALDGPTLRRESSLRPRHLAEVEAHLRRNRVDALLFPGDTTQTLPAAVADLPKMDLIFVDGGHSFETVSSDWKYVAQLGHTGTVVYFDDYPNWGVGEVVEAMDRQRWRVEILPTADELLTPDGKMSFRLARVVSVENEASLAPL